MSNHTQMQADNTFFNEVPIVIALLPLSPPFSLPFSLAAKEEDSPLFPPNNEEIKKQVTTK